MDEQDRNLWLSRCWRCKNYKPKKRTLHCELAKAVREQNKLATENIAKFTGEHGVCKQFIPID